MIEDFDPAAARKIFDDHFKCHEEDIKTHIEGAVPKAMLDRQLDEYEWKSWEYADRGIDCLRKKMASIAEGPEKTNYIELMRNILIAMAESIWEPAQLGGRLDGFHATVAHLINHNRPTTPAAQTLAVPQTLRHAAPVDPGRAPCHAAPWDCGGNGGACAQRHRGGGGALLPVRSSTQSKGRPMTGRIRSDNNNALDPRTMPPGSATSGSAGRRSVQHGASVPVLLGQREIGAARTTALGKKFAAVGYDPVAMQGFVTSYDSERPIPRYKVQIEVLLETLDKEFSEICDVTELFEETIDAELTCLFDHWGDVDLDLAAFLGKLMPMEKAHYFLNAMRLDATVRVLTAIRDEWRKTGRSNWT